VEGQRDLKQGIIRAIGNPHERFLEDRLRMMRAVRYATRFNFPIEPQTLQAILDHAMSLFPAVAMERVWQEFKKMSQFAHFDTGLITLHELNLLPTIFPQLKEVPVEEIRNRLRPLPLFPKKAPTITELLELFPDSSLEQLFALCDYLKLSRGEREAVRFLHHAKTMLRMPAAWQEKLEKIEWARFYSDPHAKLGLEIIAAGMEAEERRRFLEEHDTRWKSLGHAVLRLQTQNPVIRAEHLLREGILPGKKMGQLLKEAERMSINWEIDDPALIIALLKKSFLW
jgi:poly(A) polymerase